MPLSVRQNAQTAAQTCNRFHGAGWERPRAGPKSTGHHRELLSKTAHSTVGSLLTQGAKLGSRRGARRSSSANFAICCLFLAAETAQEVSGTARAHVALVVRMERWSGKFGPNDLPKSEESTARHLPSWRRHGLAQWTDSVKFAVSTRHRGARHRQEGGRQREAGCPTYPAAARQAGVQGITAGTPGRAHTN
jgi:hypothetical protein